MKDVIYRRCCGLDVHKEVDDLTGQGPGSVTEFSYDAAGNVLSRFDWDSTRASSRPAVGALSSSNSAWHHFTYDGHGNVIHATDPLCVTATNTYGTDDLYPISITEDSRPTTVGCTPQGPALTRVTAVQVEPATGLELNRTDYNGLSHTTVYDPIGRPTSVTDANVSNGLTLHVTKTVYSDANRRITNCTDLSTAADTATVSVTQFDQMGRLYLTGQLETANPSPGGCADTTVSGIITETRYLTGSGASYTLKSNPYRTLADDTMGWTLTVSDTLGRVTDAKSYAGSGLPSEFGGSNAVTGTVHTSYSGADQTVTDQASVSRKSTMDGLGRLVQVTEAGSVLTTYTYDALDNLTSVTQAGMTTPTGCPSGVSRCFAYDSLSRLHTANNPESGLITYGYDPAGNLTSKTDPRFTTTFGIDALGRVTSKSYSDTAVNYCYDGQTWSTSNNQCSGTASAPSIGRLTQVFSSDASHTFSSGTTLSYDTLGRVTASSQTTGGSTYSFQYTYNAAGLLSSETYPSQRKVSYTYNPLGRITTVAGVLGTATTSYAGDVNNLITYKPHGGVQSLKLGNGIVETTAYNALLQPTEIDAGTLFSLANCYDSSQSNCSGVTGLPASNNGNVWGQKVNGAARTYTYDGFNRLTSASQGGGQTYSYDTRGNRAVTGAGTNSLEVPTNYSAYTSDNRNSNWEYDGSGNVTRIPKTSLGPVIRSATYDAENRMITETTANGGTATYYYDGDGRRVKKSVTPAGGGASDTVYAYDATGNLVAEYGAAQSSGTRYLTADQLGSTRLITTATGAIDQSIDYFPFGEEITGSYPSYPQAAGSPPVKFTSKERDAETGLDYLESRYFSGAQGRFTSPDGPFNDQDPSDPQSWNLYGYVRNNPLVNTDPSGNCTVVDGVLKEDGGDPCPSTPGDSITVNGGDSGGIPWWTSPINRFINFGVHTLDVGQQAQQLVQPAIDFLFQPRNSGCMAAMTGAGAIGGAGVGMAGLAGGPAVGVTVPTGFLIGGLGAAAISTTACMKNSGPSSGGSRGGSAGGDQTVQTGGNTVSQRAADAWNKTFGKNLSRRDWGRALEAMKRENDIPNDAHSTVMKASGDIFNEGHFVDNIGSYVK